MYKVLVILRKELIEITQQRLLLLSIVLPPVLFAVLPLFSLYTIGQATGSSNRGNLPIPSLQGLTTQEFAQALVGTEFSNLYILLPMIIPSIIAAYSIIGEKTSHTLEPVLATPVRTWELLMGKILAALLPAVLVTWISGGIFIVELSILTDANVLNHVVTPGWLILFVVCTPLLGLIAVAIMTGISSRVNDTRTAQQLSVWAVLPFLGLVFGELSGKFELTPLVAIITAIILIPLAILLIWGAGQLFQRERILTRWK